MKAVIRLREEVNDKCKTFRNLYNSALPALNGGKWFPNRNGVLISALDLITTTAKKMGQYSPDPDAEDIVLYNEIKSLSKQDLQKIINETYSQGPVSIIRCVIGRMFMENKINSPEEFKITLQNLQNGFKSKNIDSFLEYLPASDITYIKTYTKGDPFRTWGAAYRYMLPFIYNTELKTTVWLAIETVRDHLLNSLDLKNTWESKNSQGWHNHARSYYGFEGPSNYGCQTSALMLHPKIIPDHKNSAQLICYFSGDTISSGLDFGVNVKNLRHEFKYEDGEFIHDESLKTLWNTDKTGPELLNLYNIIIENCRNQLQTALNYNTELIEKNPNITSTEIAEGDASISEEGDFNLFEHKVGAKTNTIDSKIYPNIKPHEDYLNRTEIAKYIANNIIKNKEIEPLNIGIYGNWGSGKTQIVNLIKEALKKPKSFPKTSKRNKKIYEQTTIKNEFFYWIKVRKFVFKELKAFCVQKYIPVENIINILTRDNKYRLTYKLHKYFKSLPYKVETIDFDAWQYNDQEHIWAALIMQIMENCKSHFWFYPCFMFHKVFSYLKNSWQECVMRFLVICGLYTFASYLGLTPEPEHIVLWKKLFLAGFTAFIPGLIKFNFINIDKTFIKYLKTPDYSNQLGFRDEIKNLTEFALNYLSNRNKKRIVLFIDNLDRCSSKNIKQILDSICQFLEICSKHRANLIVLFAMEQNVILQALQDEGVPENKKDEYLDKIVNMPVHILNPENIDKLIKRLFGYGQNETKINIQNLYKKAPFIPRKLSNLRYISNMEFQIHNNFLTEAEIENYLVKTKITEDKA